MAYKSSQSQLNLSGQKQLENDVRLVVEMIDVLDQQVKAGKITLTDAQEQVKQQMLGAKGADGKRPLNKKIDLGQYGYFFVYDTQGNFVTHPSLEGKNLSNTTSPDGKQFVQLTIQAAKNGGGFVNYTWPLPNDASQTAPKIVYAQLDPHWNWVVVAGSYLSDFNSGANQVLITLFWTLLLSAVVGGFLTYVFALRISRPLQLIAHQVDRLSAGDLEIEEVHIKNRDEIGQLAVNSNKLTQKLKLLIQSVKSNTEHLFAAAKQLAQSAEQMNEASVQITTNIVEMATGTDMQIQSISASQQTAHKLMEGAESIADHARNVSASTETALDKADRGNETILLATQQMESIHRSVQQVGEVIQSLGSRSQEIGMLSDVITGIANQTNLLALNAAIEAARAGEQGRGFAVVADEVRKLAEQSAQSAEHIGRVITHIQAQTHTAELSMEQATSEVTHGMLVVSEAGQAFEEIQQAVKQVQDKMTQVTADSSQMAVGTSEFALAIDQILQVAQDSSASAQNVSASAQEQLATMDEISSAAETLSRMSEELREIVRHFETASTGSSSVRLLDDEQRIIELVWSGVITTSIIQEANQAIFPIVETFGGQPFALLVDSRTMQVVLPEAQPAFAEHQKRLLEHGMQHAAVVIADHVAKSQLDRIKQQSGNQVETQWSSYEEALQFLQNTQLNERRARNP